MHARKKKKTLVRLGKARLLYDVDRLELAKVAKVMQNLVQISGLGRGNPPT